MEEDEALRPQNSAEAAVVAASLRLYRGMAKATEMSDGLLQALGLDAILSGGDSPEQSEAATAKFMDMVRPGPMAASTALSIVAAVRENASDKPEDYLQNLADALPDKVSDLIVQELGGENVEAGEVILALVMVNIKMAQTAGNLFADDDAPREDFVLMFRAAQEAIAMLARSIVTTEVPGSMGLNFACEDDDE